MSLVPVLVTSNPICFHSVLSYSFVMLLVLYGLWKTCNLNRGSLLTARSAVNLTLRCSSLSDYDDDDDDSNPYFTRQDESTDRFKRGR
jgi:hypothetical protein